MPKKITSKTFASMWKQVEDGQSIIAPIVKELQNYIADKNLINNDKQIFGEKDSILSAYIRLSHIQIKWVELSLALEKEQSRQREWKAKNITKEDNIKNIKEEEERELSTEEWDMLRDMMEKREYKKKT